MGSHVRDLDASHNSHGNTYISHSVNQTAANDVLLRLGLSSFLLQCLASLFSSISPSPSPSPSFAVSSSIPHHPSPSLSRRAQPQSLSRSEERRVGKEC